MLNGTDFSLLPQVKWVANFLKFYLVQSFIGLINCRLLLLSSFFFLSYKWGIYSIPFEFIVSFGSIFTTGCLILYKKSLTAFICLHLKLIVGTKGYVYRLKYIYVWKCIFVYMRIIFRDVKWYC